MLKYDSSKIVYLLLVLLTATLLYRFLSTNTLNNDILIYHDDANITINPNNADWPSLARLPGIGAAKAKAIIAYRDQSNQPVFKSADDLTAVKGIGIKTVHNIKTYLIFDKEK